MCKKPRDLKGQHEARHHIFSTGISLSETRFSCRPHVCYSGTSPSSQAFSLLTSLSRSWSAFGPLHHRLAHFVDEICMWVGGSSLVCLVSVSCLDRACCIEGCDPASGTLRTTRVSCLELWIELVLSKIAHSLRVTSAC
ncbi:hypothetical protein M405DRAFT_424734 [Rhizopogon salebrosus TDB-379]|nr:hypothetical protein M405DRAFT_424734 [Rhizopogon salebrosus TDB-379]